MSQLNPALTVSWRDYYELCKPRVVALIVFTAVVGMFLATPGMVPPAILIFGTLGIGLMAASAAAINHVADHRIDAVMVRTKYRPLPQGELSKPQALAFAAVIGVLGMTLLVAFVNALAAALSEEPATLSEVHEPFLLQLGLIERTQRGRVATRKAYEHLGMTPPQDLNERLI